MDNTTSHLTPSTAHASPPIRHQQLLVTPPISLPKTSQIASEQNSNSHRAAAAPAGPKRRRRRPIGLPANGRGGWSKPEEREIVRLHKSGETWDNIAKKLPGRTAQGCRRHYWNHLANGALPIRLTRWSEPEELEMVRLHEYGKPWDYIAGKLPGRTVHGCRSHYLNIDKEKRNRLASLYERYGFKSLSTLLTR